MADIFISYTSSDADWAKWLHRELAALGHTPHIHEWEIAAGDDIYAWMEARHDAADHVLCVVSDQYLKAPYSTLERHAALWQAASKRPGFVLLVAVKPCRFPTLADQIRRCELFGVADDIARERFRAFMAKPDASATSYFPGQAFAVSNIPIRVPAHFLGREDSLMAIGAALKRYEGRVAIAALHGLRGVGKTTLAAAYAERHRTDYRATWWISAATESGTRADLVGLGVRLGWVAADEKEAPALAVAMERLRHEGEGILLIYDNAVDARSLKPYLPPGGAAQVLVTSNAPAWRGVAEPVEIRLWPTEIGADYLIVRTGRDAERAAAESLSEALGGLPLAHEQAAAYCERLGVSLSDYAQRFAAAPAKFLDAARDAPAAYHDGLTVAKTFALAIDEAAKLHPAAEPLIVHAALLAPEPIPLFLFAEGRGEFGEPLASALADDGLDEAVAALRAFALVDRETIPDERDPSITTDCIRLHRLVRQVAAMRREGEAREDARRSLVKAMAAVYPKDIWGSPKNWPRARRLELIASALVDGDLALPDGADEQSVRLLEGLAEYGHWVLGAYTEARRLYERLLVVCETRLGANSPYALASMHNLAILLGDVGDHAGARALLERFVTIVEKEVGPEHPAVASSVTSLAIALVDQGEFGAARPLFERALAIRERELGPDDPSTGMSIGNLASLLKDQGDLVAALPLHKRALEVLEKAFGPVHPSTAIGLTALAENLRDLGEFSDAQPLFERALAIEENLLGRHHPRTNRGRCNLAHLHLASGEPAEALALAEAALAAHDKALGPKHAWTKDSARATADALDAFGRADKAAAIRARHLSPEPPVAPSDGPTG